MRPGRCAFARDLADGADAITLPAFLSGPRASAKADGTPITEPTPRSKP